MVSTFVSQQEGPMFDPQVDHGHLPVFVCPPPPFCMCGFLPQSKDMRIKSAGYSKLPTSVNMSPSLC